MTYTTLVRGDGYVFIGAYRELGYEPGTVVEVARMSTGSLLIRVDDSLPIDLAAVAVYDREDKEIRS